MRKKWRLGTSSPSPPKWRKRLSGTWRPGGERYLRIIFFWLEVFADDFKESNPPRLLWSWKGSGNIFEKTPPYFFSCETGLVFCMVSSTLWVLQHFGSAKLKVQHHETWSSHLRGWEVQKPLRQNWNRLKMIWASLQLNRSLFSLLAPVELFFFKFWLGWGV